MSDCVDAVGAFFQSKYKGAGLPALPSPGVVASGKMSEYACISSKCVCRCGGGWCRSSQSTGVSNDAPQVAV